MYHDSYGGAELAAEKMIALTSSGHEVSVMALPPLSGRDSSIYRVRTIRQYFGMFGTLLTSLFPFDPLSYHDCRKHLKSVRPDVVHLHKFDAISCAIVSAAGSLDIPVVYSVYDYWLFCPTAMFLRPDSSICMRNDSCVSCLRTRRGGFVRALLFPITRWILRRCVSQIDAFIVLSGASYLMLHRNGIPKKKISTVYLPFKSAAPSTHRIEKNAVLYAGWLEPHKGLHVLVDAMKIVVEKIPSAKLYVIGEYRRNPGYHSLILKKIKESGLQKNILLLGKLSQDEFKKRFDSVKVVAIPEQWENMSPLFLIESLSAEKAVVASKVGGIPEFIDDGKDGYLVFPDDAAGFAQRIVEMLSDGSAASSFGRKARTKILCMFNEKDILEKLINVYQSTFRYGK